MTDLKGLLVKIDVCSTDHFEDQLLFTHIVFYYMTTFTKYENQFHFVQVYVYKVGKEFIIHQIFKIFNI